MGTLKTEGHLSKKKKVHAADYRLMLSHKASGNKHNPSFITKRMNEGETRRETTTNRPGLFKTETAPWQPIAV